jgi:putative sterol carrier protein
MAITLKELFERMPDAFLPDKAGDMDAVIQFNFSGEEASDWIVNIKDKACTVAEGIHESPTMTFAADSQDYKDIVTGKTNAMNAFMQGKVKLQGNLNLAMKFTEIFKLG